MRKILLVSLIVLAGSKVGDLRYRQRVARIPLILTNPMPKNWFKPVIWHRVSENQRNLGYPPLLVQFA